METCLLSCRWASSLRWTSGRPGGHAAGEAGPGVVGPWDQNPGLSEEETAASKALSPPELCF